MKPQKELETVYNWVCNVLRGESTAPWEWYQYMKLKESVGLILQGVDPLSGFHPTRVLTVVKPDSNPEEVE